MNALFLSEVNKLKNIQAYLEKNDTLLSHISAYEGDFGLVECYMELEKNRKSDNDVITNELKSVWRQLQAKKTILKENVSELDLHTFKKDMVYLQDKLYSLRMKLLSTAELLENQEKPIKEINEIYNKKLEEWEKPVKISINHNVPGTKITRTEHKEVSAFMDFVNKSNGHQNGWSNEDHQLFIRLRHKYKNIEDLSVNLNKLLPDISTDSIKEHNEWFNKYMLLKKRKNEALKKWRRQKQETAHYNKLEETEPPKPEVKLKPMTDNIREQIAMWKAEKEAQRRRAKLQERMKEARVKLLEEDKKRIHHHVKQEVTKWREEKVTQEKFEKMQKEIEEDHIKRIRAATANRMIKHFQSQDDFFIAKLRSQKLTEKNKSKPRSRSSYMVERNPDRILKPTKQWLLRTKKDDFPKEHPLYIPNIREVPKLKVPDWRKNN